MKKIYGIRRQTFINFGIPSSDLNVLSQRSRYFRERKSSIFLPFDALLITIASELFDWLPFRNVDGIIDSIVEVRSNLYGLLELNPRQYLVVEKIPMTPDLMPDILTEFRANTILIETLETEGKKYRWGDRRSMVFVNLEKVYQRVQEMYDHEGFKLGEVGYETNLEAAL